LGVWAVGGAIAAAVGPLLGGVLTTVDWRLVFGVNIPVCAAMLLLLILVATSPTRPAPFDWAGQVLGVVALTSLTYGLIHGGSVGFSSPSVIVILVIAVGSLVGFVAVQARGRHPMMPLELFDSAGMRIALLVGFAFMVGWFGIVFLCSLFLQQQLGLSPLLAGLAFLLSALFAVVGNLISGPVTIRFGTRVPVVVGLLSMAVGLTAMVVAAPGDRLCWSRFSLSRSALAVLWQCLRRRAWCWRVCHPSGPGRRARCSTLSGRSAGRSRSRFSGRSSQTVSGSWRGCRSAWPSPQACC
jgi:DHA2 family methylenomycin A resistance protein-like MFS transporter